MGDALTSVLDFLGLLVIALGIFCLIGGGWGLVAGGAFLLLGSFVASSLNAPHRPKQPRSDE